MDFFEAVKKRRSLTRFTSQPVPQEDILTMLRAAVLAPSATNEQPWRFIAIRDRELRLGMRDFVNTVIDATIAATDNESRRQHLSRMRHYSTHFAEAPVAIAVLARPWVGGGYSRPTDPAHRDLALQSVAMAVAHLQLAATALGYASCFASSPAEFAREELEALLEVDRPWFLVGIVSLGVPAKPFPARPPRKPLEEVCNFIG